MRSYFSVPDSMAKAKARLNPLQSQVEAQLLQKMQELEMLEKRLEIQKGDPGHPLSTTALSTDAPSPVCHARHKLGGSMLNRDGNVRGWNNRFTTGIRQNNDLMHPLHREYFTAASLFDHSAAQRWRRLHHVENSSGVWVSDAIEKPPRFPPMGTASFPPLSCESDLETHALVVP